MIVIICHHNICESLMKLLQCLFVVINRGESVTAIESAMFPKGITNSALHIVMLDNMDVAFQKLAESLTAISLSSTFLNAIDTFRLQTARKGFVIATCTDLSLVPESFFRLARFGLPEAISFPSMPSRFAVASQVLKTLSDSVLDQLLICVEESSLNEHRAGAEVGGKEMIISNNDKRAEFCDILSTEIARRTQV